MYEQPVEKLAHLYGQPMRFGEWSKMFRKVRAWWTNRPKFKENRTSQSTHMGVHIHGENSEYNNSKKRTLWNC